MSPSPCETLPGLQAFPSTPRRRNHQAKPHIPPPSATPDAKPHVPPRYRASLQRGWHTAAGRAAQATTHGCSGRQDGGHNRPCSSTGLEPADPRAPGVCASAHSPGQLFPLFTPSRKEELVSKGKIQSLMSCGASSRISEGQETGTYSPLESDLQKDPEDVNLPCQASVSPPALHCHRGYLWLCLSYKWEKDAGALPAVFRPKLQAMARLSLLSASSEQGQRSALRGKRRIKDINKEGDKAGSCRNIPSVPESPQVLEAGGGYGMPSMVDVLAKAKEPQTPKPLLQHVGG